MAASSHPCTWDGWRGEETGDRASFQAGAVAPISSRRTEFPKGSINRKLPEYHLCAKQHPRNLPQIALSTKPQDLFIKHRSRLKDFFRK